MFDWVRNTTQRYRISSNNHHYFKIDLGGGDLFQGRVGAYSKTDWKDNNKDFHAK